MAKQKIPSWAERRWKVFEQTYSENKSLRDELNEYTPALDDNLYVVDEYPLYRILQKYEIPFVCIHSVGLYLNNPNLNRNEYTNLILPPFIIWDTEKDKVIFGKMDIPLSTYLQLRLSDANQENAYKTDFKELDYAEIAKAFSDNKNVVIEVMPNVQKTELIEFINDNWSSIEKSITFNETQDNITFSDKLMGKVGPTKTKTQIARNNMIAELYKKGLSDYTIRIELREAKYGDLEENNIKQIRHKLGLTKKRSKKL